MYNQAPQAGLASLLASRGRNGDSVLVHMAPEEVAGLQRLAMAHGGSLTVNPETGLYEASFLKKLLPMIVGAVLPSIPVVGPALAGVAKTIGFGNQAIGTGLLIGGATSLIEGDLKKGLMAGLSAYSGASLSQALNAAATPAAPVRPSAEEMAKTTDAIKAARETVGATEAATQAASAPVADGLNYFKSANVFKGTPSAADLAMGRLANVTGAQTSLGLAALAPARGVTQLISSPEARTAFNQSLGGPVAKYATFLGAAEAMTPEYKMPTPAELNEDYVYIPGEVNPLYGQGYDQPYFLPGKYYKRTPQGLTPYDPYKAAPGANVTKPWYGAAGGPVSAPDQNQQTALPHQNPTIPGNNPNYPLSTVMRANYSPIQTRSNPESQEILSGYGPKINPFSGEERFAEGGEVDDPEFIPGAFLERRLSLPPAGAAPAQDKYDYALADYNKKVFENAMSILTMNPGMTFNQAKNVVLSRSQFDPAIAGGAPDPSKFGVSGPSANFAKVGDPSANFNWGADLGYDPSIYSKQFDWQKYILANPDLEKAGIDTPWEAATHYATYGKNENRPGVSFLGSADNERVPRPDPFEVINPFAGEERVANAPPVGSVRPPVGDPVIISPLPPSPPPGPKSPPDIVTINPPPGPQNVPITTQPPTPQSIAEAKARYQQMVYGPPPAPRDIKGTMDYLAALNAAVKSPYASTWQGPPPTTPPPPPPPPPSRPPGGPEGPGDGREPGGGQGTPSPGGGVSPPSPPFPTFPPSTPGTTPAPAPAPAPSPDGKETDENIFDKFRNWFKKRYEDADAFDLIGLGIGAQYGLLASALWSQLTPTIKKIFSVGTTELNPEEVAALDAKAKEEADRIKKEKEAQEAKDARARGEGRTRETSTAGGGYTPSFFGPSTGGIGGLMGGRGIITIDQNVKQSKRGGQIRAMQTGGMTAPNPYGAAVGEDYNFGFAEGGMPEYQAGGKLLDGPGDGMSDDIPAVIRGKGVQRAALADGEFVIPADVVSHLGNGSTKAGAKKLYQMMNQIRKARTGKTKQAPAVKAERYLPK